MCTDYELNIQIEPFLEQVNTRNGYPPIVWIEGSTRSTGMKPHVRIADRGIVVRLHDDHLRAEWLPWAWEERGHRLFNLSTEKRLFADSNRCLVLATGFYEYTPPLEPKGKLWDQHLVRLIGHPWFWIAGIVKHGAFTMLTKTARSVVRQFHCRQVCILPPSLGLAWLQLSMPAASLLKNTPRSSLEIFALRKDYVLRPRIDASLSE